MDQWVGTGFSASYCGQLLIILPYSSTIRRTYTAIYDLSSDDTQLCPFYIMVLFFRQDHIEKLKQSSYFEPFFSRFALFVSFGDI